MTFSFICQKQSCIEAVWVRIFIIIIFITSCEDEPAPLLPGLFEDVRYLSLSQNSSSFTLIANGINQIQFEIFAYDVNRKKIPYYNSASLEKVKIEVNGKTEISYPYQFSTTTEGDYSFKLKGISSNATFTESIKITAIKDETYEAIALPVIFHYITKDVLTSSQQKELSDLFSNSLIEVNKGFQNLRGSTDPNSANSYIQFSLADTTPEGNPIDFKGLDMIYSPIQSFGNISNSTIDILIWDGNFWSPKKYVNVWVTPIDDRYSWAYFPEFNSSSSGYPTIPYGVVFNNKHLNDPMVLAHELGHMLNLRHVFEDACGENDYCLDTWSYPRIFDDFETAWTLEKKSCYEEPFTSNNYMDYFPCLNTTFSFQQVVRMQFVLANALLFLVQRIWQTDG